MHVFTYTVTDTVAGLGNNKFQSREQTHNLKLEYYNGPWVDGSGAPQ